MSFEPGQAHGTRGEISAEISTTFVQLVKEHAGRGPTKCRTYIDDDLVTFLQACGASGALRRDERDLQAVADQVEARA